MRNRVIVNKLIEYAEKIIGYCNALSYAEFIDNSMVVEACVFNLSQMGELPADWMQHLWRGIPIYLGLRSTVFGTELSMIMKELILI